MTRTTVLLLALATAGCGASDPCAKDPASCQGAGSGGASSAGSSGGSDAGSDAQSDVCPGECVQVLGPWSDGLLLWLGPEGATLPTCPQGLYMASYPRPGYADAPPAAVECPPCTCSVSLNECVVPHKMNAGKTPCPGALTQPVPFNAPDPWDGTCTAVNAIPSASSLDVPSPSPLTFSYCQASSDPPIMLSGGTTRALMCSGVGAGGLTCPKLGDICSVSRAPGFMYCVGQDGDVPACPDGWPSRHVIYTDDKECNCACSQPMGDKCVTTISVYSDSACTKLLAATMMTSDQTDMCIDLPAGSSLGSKSATLPVYMPGTCMPILTKSQAQTLCCQP